MIKKDFNVGSDIELDVHTYSGRVEVKTGSPGFVSVEVETRDQGFIVEKRGDLIYVSSDKEAGWLSRGSSYVTVEVPEGTDVTIGTASARTECRGDLGRVEVKTASGNVDVETAGGVVIKSASGDAQVGVVLGEFRASSASGDIRVERAEGNSVFSSASGDIRVEDGQGTITMSTASGNMRVSQFTGSRASFKSMSGNVHIGIPAGTKVDLDATLLSGKLKLPKDSAGAPAERQMSVKAKIVSGNLTVNRL